MIGIGQEGRLADKAGSRELSDQEPGEVCAVDMRSRAVFEANGHPRRVICDADEWQPYGVFHPSSAREGKSALFILRGVDIEAGGKDIGYEEFSLPPVPGRAGDALKLS